MNNNNLPLAEKTWLILPETPISGETSTGKHFAILRNVIGFDFDGSPIPGEKIFESHLLDSVVAAENFVESSQYPRVAERW